MRSVPRSEKAWIPVGFVARCLESGKTAKAHLPLLSVSFQVIREGDTFKSMDAWFPEFQALLESNTKEVRSCLQNSTRVRMKMGMNVSVREQDGVCIKIFVGTYWRFSMRFSTVLCLGGRDEVL